MRRAIATAGICAASIALGASVAQAATLDPIQADFGSEPLGPGVGRTQTFVLARSTPTEVYHIDLDYDTPDGPRAFPFMDSCPTAFNFGNPETQSCSFSVTFNPFREGPITVFLKTGNSLDDLGEPVATLSGAGLPAAKSKKKGRCKKKGKKKGKKAAGTAKKRKGCKKKGKKKRR